MSRRTAAWDVPGFVFAWASVAVLFAGTTAQAQSDVPPAAPAADHVAVKAAAATDSPGVEGESHAAQRLSVLVLPLEPRRVDRELARTLDGVLVAHLARREHLHVTTMADLEVLFEAERLKDFAGCEDVACSSEISGALGADRILAGSVGRIDERLVLTLRWLDAVYATPLAHVTRTVSGEAGLAEAVPGALAELFEESAAADAQARHDKRRPTFWTAELAAGSGWRLAPEPYELDVAAELRLAWGGKPRGADVYFYALAGVGGGYLAGESEGRVGRIRYSRTQIVPFVELRAALPVANRGRTRVYASGGLGLGFELYQARQQDGLEPRGSLRLPELRLACGVWHRWNRLVSFFGGYLLRLHFAGGGADSVSELVELGSSRSTLTHHAFALGGALHF